MNDPSTLATTAHDDRDGPPPTPDPTTGPPIAAAPAAPAPPVTPAAPTDPVPPAAPAVQVTPTPEAGATATAVPTAQPAPGGGPEAPAQDPHSEPIRTLLETAATCRPVEEVTALVSLLKQTGQLPDRGHEALRAAAVSRPVHEVRHMVALLGEHPHEEGEADVTLRAAAVGRSIEDVALLVSILGPDGTPRTDRAQAPAPPPPAPAAERAWGDPVKRERDPGRGAPRPAPARNPARPQGPLRHLLRWPTAAVLLLCGVVHLPGDLALRPAPGPGDLPALAVALLCLGLGALLAVRDTALVWRAAAVTALAVVALHVVGGVVFYDPLDGALGGPHAWAGIATVLCAGAAALLAGVALKYPPDRTRAGGGA
ncbi:hypothetical protein ABZZ17_04585 [Streptomyces sp. NPDC006512]|uniref:hypothetical protein n=1 Tax=Streptomyces sp. NPDC006512 TaxID=3154307 RepID=UPI0033A9F770